jgi:hypothetical protein
MSEDPRIECRLWQANLTVLNMCDITEGGYKADLSWENFILTRNYNKDTELYINTIHVSQCVSNGAKYEQFWNHFTSTEVEEISR